MTPSQATEQFTRLFVAFPFIRNQINASEEPTATLAAWCRMVVTIDADDFAQAVDDILDGKVTISLKPWDIAELPLALRARAGRIADARRAKAKNDQTRAEIAAKGSRKCSLGNLPVNIKIANLAGFAHRDGRMSTQRRDQIMAYLRKQNETPDVPTEVPADLVDDYRSSGSGRRRNPF